jgi:hypothetical protein
LRGWSLFLYGTTCNSGSGACDYCRSSIADAVLGSSPLQTNRWVRDGIVSSCGSAKAWAGFDALGSKFHYNAYMYTNTTSSDACVTVQLQGGNDVMAALYLNSFNPGNIYTNWLGDAGLSTAQAVGGVTTFSCSIPPGAPFVVVVNETTLSSDAQSYTLQLSGLPCPPPTLNIQKVAGNQARLYWDTSGGGYVLQSISNLTATAWGGVTNEPIVSGGNYNVTNTTLVPTTNRFYRLQMP